MVRIIKVLSDPNSDVIPVWAETRLKAFDRDVRSEVDVSVALTVTVEEVFLPLTSKVTVPAAEKELILALVTA